MCGRTACALQPDAIARACNKCLNRGGGGSSDSSKTTWRNAPNGATYYPSHNVCPGSYTPVLFAADHVKRKTTEGSVKEEDQETTVEGQETSPMGYFLQPMAWGLVPSWSKSSKTDYKTINARSESMLSKATYKRPLEKGRRCVVLVDGYFEWQVAQTSGKKQPYFIYPPEEEKTEEGEKALLALAGIFDVWHSKEDNTEVFSYSVITVESHEKMSWLHSRMPAVLTSNEAIADWLDHGRVPLEEATKLIKATEMVKFHPVSETVNTSKNKGEECIQAVDLKKDKKSEAASASFMQSWLKKGKRGGDEGQGSAVDEPKEKKPC